VSTDELPAEPIICRTSNPPLRVLLVADVRSPTTWGWVEAVRSAGVVVLGIDGLPWPEHRPVNAASEALSQRIKRRLHAFAGATPRRLKGTERVRQVTGPLLAPIKGRRMRAVVRRTRPDVVHALRIPCEAMAARAACPPTMPLAVSIWGNDLTLQASKSYLTRCATRKVLARADLLFADCQRDIDLARSFGLRSGTPTAVLPGGGGINLEHLAEAGRIPTPQLTGLAGSDDRVVVNPRGCRSYVRNDILLEALSLLAPGLDPHVRIIFIDSAHDVALQRSIEHHPLGNRITVTGKRSPAEMLAVFRRAEVSVSITDHDGTPNSLLEAMAAGAVPVCGDLPSIREWVESGKNGFLAPSNDPRAVAEALRLALNLSDAERAAIRAENSAVIAAKAERGAAGKQAAERYRELVTRLEGHVLAAQHTPRY
jgi:glycosyltransferase involved in cell wall biosynthesis